MTAQESDETPIADTLSHTSHDLEELAQRFNELARQFAADPVTTVKPEPAKVVSPTPQEVRKSKLLDLVERAGWSAGQTFFAALTVGGTVTAAATLPWKYASITALGAFVTSLLLTAILHLIQRSPSAAKQLSQFWVDLGVRLAKTFVAAFFGVVAADLPFNVLTYHWQNAFNVAAVATLGALAKGILARGSDTDGAERNPSTLRAATYTEAQGLSQQR
jgi:hypothetical protein